MKKIKKLDLFKQVEGYPKTVICPVCEKIFTNYIGLNYICKRGRETVKCIHKKQKYSTNAINLAWGERDRQRIHYAKDLIQPFDKDGLDNKDFKKIYPNSEAIKKRI